MILNFNLESERVLVLGAAGKFGGLFSRTLMREGSRVWGADLAPQPDGGDWLGYAMEDLRQASGTVLAWAAQCDYLICCLPSGATLDVLERMMPILKPGCLVVEMVAAKLVVEERLAPIRDDLALLGLNPMFGPDLGFRHQNIATIIFRGSVRLQGFIEKLKEWGTRPTLLSAREHDHCTAMSQVALHALIVAYGSLLAQEGFGEKFMALSTPPQRAMLSLLGRILQQPAEVYHSIQFANPHAGTMRNSLKACLDRFDHVAEEEDGQAFSDLLEGIREKLAPFAISFSAEKNQ
jgi:prephenate dehydrogenase